MSSNISLQIDIVGHSGDSPDIKFVSSAAPPSNDKERLNVLEVHTYIHVLVHMYWGYIQYMCTCVSYITVYANYFSTRIMFIQCVHTLLLYVVEAHLHVFLLYALTYTQGSFHGRNNYSYFFFLLC